ncbi:MAG: glycerol kinase GlpK [Acidobacteriota bacterium]
MAELLGSIDQGTTSTRFIVFNPAGEEITKAQMEHEQILPQQGWVEHNPEEIIKNTYTVVEQALRKAGLQGKDLNAIGITNQRETSLLWDRRTGKPVCNALVWQDTRTDKIISRIEKKGQGEIIWCKSGLPPATYFSAGKIRWILDMYPELTAQAEKGDILFGNMDTWLIWNLTGGPDGGLHATDITNASRTMLMNLANLEWDEELCGIFGVPPAMLPEIRPSSGSFGETLSSGPFRAKVPILGVLGDQQAATVGQACFNTGEAKNTYGTGNFMLSNTGTQIIPSRSGLLTTTCYQQAGQPAVYALEGSIAVTGSAVQWLRDQLGLITTAAEIEPLAKTVMDNGGVYFVPAFSGLFAPYWRSDARGVMVGLTRYANKGHLARATLEAICYQTKDVLGAMNKDSGIELQIMKVDGGATVNNTLMQLQADILGVPVIRPQVTETTALGAAYAAGLASGVYGSLDDLKANWRVDRQWEPSWSDDQRESGHSQWKKAVQRTLDWV